MISGVMPFDFFGFGQLANVQNVNQQNNQIGLADDNDDQAQWGQWLQQDLPHAALLAGQAEQAEQADPPANDLDMAVHHQQQNQPIPDLNAPVEMDIDIEEAPGNSDQSLANNIALENEGLPIDLNVALGPVLPLLVLEEVNEVLPINLNVAVDPELPPMGEEEVNLMQIAYQQLEYVIAIQEGAFIQLNDLLPGAQDKPDIMAFSEQNEDIEGLLQNIQEVVEQNQWQQPDPLDPEIDGVNNFMQPDLAQQVHLLPHQDGQGNHQAVNLDIQIGWMQHQDSNAADPVFERISLTSQPRIQMESDYGQGFYFFRVCRNSG